MSDLYLVLRRRLDDVNDWVPLSTEVMKAARKRLNLSYEAVARQIPIAAKTYERWEKAGRVQRASLAKIAEVLELRIEQPDHVPIKVTVPQGSDSVPVSIGELRRETQRLQRRFDEQIAEVLRRLPPALDPPQEETG